MRFSLPQSVEEAMLGVPKFSQPAVPGRGCEDSAFRPKGYHLGPGYYWFSPVQVGSFMLGKAGEFLKLIAVHTVEGEVSELHHSRCVIAGAVFSVWAS